jgi:hypothetical protein
MTVGPKGVAGRPDSLPAQQIAADPLQNYCPDLDQWPANWAYEARDIPYGLRIVQCFKPFLREMLALSLSRKTLRQHRDNIWVLGGEVISRLQMDSGLRRRSARACRQLSQHSAETRWNAARKFLAVLS